MTVHFAFSVTRRPKTDAQHAQHEQTVAEFAARIRALEAELEQHRVAADLRPLIDLAAERARRRPDTGGIA